MSQQVSRCKYFYSYEKIDTKESEDYSCSKQALESGLCKFHDPNFLTSDTRDIITREFLREIESTLSSRMVLKCIGYHLPGLNLKHFYFNLPVYFINVKFKESVDFSNVEFKTLSFKKSEFSDKITFRNMKISNYFDFSQTKNLSKSKFQNVQVDNNSDFSNIQFNNLRFIECRLNSSTFRYSVFNETSEFNESIFSEKTDFRGSEFNDIVNFHNIDFKEQKSVFFNDNLSNVSFKNTDITRINFDEKVRWGKPDRYSIQDNRELMDHPESSSLSSVLAIYRNLRENYEFRLMYEEAGQCFIKEMELKRIYFEDKDDKYKTKIKKVRRYISLTNCYNVSCQYGESFKRVSFWILGIFFVAGTAFFLNPDINNLNETQPLGDIDYSSEIANNFVFRLEISANKIFDSFFEANSNDLFQNIVRVSGLGFLGMSIVVLRRRFERRFRH